jgi:hypothetical protein
VDYTGVFTTLAILANAVVAGMIPQLLILIGRRVAPLQIWRRWFTNMWAFSTPLLQLLAMQALGGVLTCVAATKACRIAWFPPFPPSMAESGG